MRSAVFTTITFAILAGAGLARADDAGKALYDKTCKSCHGADGHGDAARAKMLKLDAAALDLGRSEAAAVSRDEKRKIVVDGKAKMPAYGKKLAAADIDLALDHALGLVGGAAAAPPKATPPAATPTPPATAPTAPAPAAAPSDAAALAKAKPLWKKSCQSCHAADGHGAAAKAKALKIDASSLDLGRDAAAGLSRDEKRAIVAGGKGKMPAYAKKLKAAQLDLLTAYSVKLAEDLRAKK